MLPIPKNAVPQKAISEIISVLLVTLITTALIGTVYIWGSPMITKRQDKAKVDRVYSYFNEESSNSLVYKIEYVARNGGKETFFSNTNGVWTLREYGDPMSPDPSNNSIEFQTFSKVSNVVIADPSKGIEWAPLSTGGSCPPEEGFVGVDSPLVVCAKADDVTDGFTITYRTWSRVLNDPSGTKGYRIDMLKDPNSGLASTGNSVTVSRKNVFSCNPPDSRCPDKKLIITEIEVLLV